MPRLLILTTALTAILAFFGARALLSGDSAPPPTQQTAQTYTTMANVAALEQTAADRPDDGEALVNLAAAYLQRSRETGDPSFYGRADTAVNRALALDANDVNALVMAGTLAASQHDFAAALSYGERARDLEPTLIASYSVIVDALIELGRYDEATAAAQQRADLRPDFAALTRISYLRELHGDLDGAIAAMQQAVDAGTGVKQDTVWGLVLLGNLNLTKGDIDAAALAYERADALLPGDAMSQFGLARLAIARDDYPAAERLLRLTTMQRPLPEYLILLGDVLTAQGRTAEAEDQYATVRAIQQLFSSSGVDTDIELALFDADHAAHDATDATDPQATYAAALSVFESGRQSIYVADTVAWAAYKAGRLEEAQSYMTLALRLGTQDPRLAYHAGVIAQSAGQGAAAQQHFEAAVRMESGQSVLYIAPAREALSQVTVARDQ